MLMLLRVTSIKRSDTFSPFKEWLWTVFEAQLRQTKRMRVVREVETNEKTKEGG